MLNERPALDVRVVVVGFAAAGALGEYQHRLGLDDVPVLSDAERRSYAAFGLGRGSTARVWLHPRVWRRYWQLLRAGHRLQAAHEDTRQLGGDALLGPDGRVQWIHRSRGPEDRPSLETVRREIERGRAHRRPPAAPGP